MSKTEMQDRISLLERQTKALRDALEIVAWRAKMEQLEVEWEDDLWEDRIDEDKV